MRRIFLALALCVVPLSALAQTPVYGGPAITYWTANGVNTGTNWSFVQNKEVFTAYDIPMALAVGNVCVRPSTADNTATNRYSATVYNSSGIRVLDTGAVPGSTLVPSVAQICIAFTSSAILPPGRYYIGMTTNCSVSCGVLSSGTLAYMVPLVLSQDATNTSGGAANSTITVPADNPAPVGSSPWVELRK